MSNLFCSVGHSSSAPAAAAVVEDLCNLLQSNLFVKPLNC